MNKSEISASVAHRLGSRIEDMLEAAKHEVSRWNGYKEGASKSSKSVEHLLAQLSKDSDEGVLAPELANEVKRWVLRAIQACDGVSKNAENLSLIAQGQVKGLESAVHTARQEWQSAKAKAEAMKAAEEAPPAADGHPGDTIKAERQEA